MANILKKYDRIWFIILIIITFIFFGLSFLGFFLNSECTPKLVITTGLFAIVTGVVQLEISGLFDKVLEEYCSDEKYPYGPPSYITREIIDNPDTPVRTWLRYKCFFEVRTGFWLIVIGTLFQIIGVWL